jgi:hypothetical protein
MTKILRADHSIDTALLIGNATKLEDLRSHVRRKLADDIARKLLDDGCIKFTENFDADIHRYSTRLSTRAELVFADDRELNTLRDRIRAYEQQYLDVTRENAALQKVIADANAALSKAKSGPSYVITGLGINGCKSPD